MLFSTLTREDCVRLRKLDNGRTPNLRGRQVELLRLFLDKRGYTYYQRATFEFLKDLAPFESSVKWGEKSDYPQCLLQSFRIMFDAFDEFLKDKIGDHYELQGWESPDGAVVWCEDYFDEQEAKEAYYKATHSTDTVIHDCIYLRKVDKEGMPIEDIACNF